MFYEDVKVISIIITNFIVQKIIILNESATNVLLNNAFGKMKLPKEGLMPM